jgi:hypothetical protein
VPPLCTEINIRWCIAYSLGPPIKALVEQSDQLLKQKRMSKWEPGLGSLELDFIKIEGVATLHPTKLFLSCCGWDQNKGNLLSHLR